MLVGPLYHHECLNGTGYPNGLTKKDIPYYAQIIHIADVFDAIVAKRQYKTHINISETLKLLIKDAEPSIQSVALDALATDSRYGKINPRVLNVLFKVVIDDTLYEISCTMEYVNYLKDQLKRLHKIKRYGEKAENSKKDKDKDYYQECMEILFEQGENFGNYLDVIDEYNQALKNRSNVIEKLYREITIIKKLNPNHL